MVRLVCQNENCLRYGKQMDIKEDDCRQEQQIIIYECEECCQQKEHRKEFDQNGLVVHDDFIDL